MCLSRDTRHCYCRPSTDGRTRSARRPARPSSRPAPTPCGSRACFVEKGIAARWGSQSHLSEGEGHRLRGLPSTNSFQKPVSKLQGSQGNVFHPVCYQPQNVTGKRLGPAISDPTTPHSLRFSRAGSGGARLTELTGEAGARHLGDEVD